jgi:hypothetical protein
VQNDVFTILLSVEYTFSIRIKHYFKHSNTKAETMKVKEEDKAVLIALAKNGSRRGDTVSELAVMTGFTSHRLISVAKRYNGITFKSFQINYLVPMGGSAIKSRPGIANARTGADARIPAEISVRTFRRTK